VRPPQNTGLDSQASARITVEEIAQRLSIGRQTIYAMLKQGILPGIRLGQRWLITRHAYEEWEKTCGTSPRPGLLAPLEVTGWTDAGTQTQA
jgi:excisionase family DNA binding protein